MKLVLLLSIAAAMPAAASEPAVFAPDAISDAREQWRLSFAPDGRTAYFAASDGFFPITRQATIYVSSLEDGAWSKPTVAPFSGQHPDMDPAFSADGKRLYFSSIRGERGDVDLWMVAREGEGWSAPIRLGDEINSADDELYPSVSSDGTLYFARGPMRPLPGQHFDIYSATATDAGFAAPQKLPPAINTEPVEGGGLQDSWEFNPEISADGRTLYFTSLRPGGAGLGDIYVSRLVDGAWTPARNLGAPVNTAADEDHPTRSRDGKTLYFVRRVPAPGDFYSVPITFEANE